MKDKMIIEKYNKTHNLNEILTIDLEAVEEFYDLIKGKYNQDELLHISKTDHEKKGEYFIGTIKNRVVAICGYKIISDDTVELKRFRVTKTLRSQGLGSELLHYIESRLKDKGFNKIILETAVLRPSTLQFYRNRKYIVVDEGIYGELKTIKFEKLL